MDVIFDVKYLKWKPETVDIILELTQGWEDARLTLPGGMSIFVSANVVVSVVCRLLETEENNFRKSLLLFFFFCRYPKTVGFGYRIVILRMQLRWSGKEIIHGV